MASKFTSRLTSAPAIIVICVLMVAGAMRHWTLTDRYTRIAARSLEAEIAYQHSIERLPRQIRIRDISGRYGLLNFIGLSQRIAVLDENPVMRVAYSDGVEDHTRYFQFRYGHPTYSVDALVEIPAWSYYLNLRL